MATGRLGLGGRGGAGLAIVVALALGIARWAGADDAVLSLDRALVLALQNNPSLRAQDLAVAAARAGETTARLRPNPVLSIETADLTVMVTQLIELGGKRARRIESARLATDIATSDLADARRSLVLTVRSAFAAGLLAQSNLASARENALNFQRVEELNQLRFDAGEISRSDFLKVHLQALQFAGDVEDATVGVATAKSALRALIASPDFAQDFDLEAAPAASGEAVPSLESLKTRALAARPDLKSAETAVQKAQAEWRLARAGGATDLSLAVGWQHTGPSFGPPWFEPFYSKAPVTNTLGFGLSVPLRIFDRNQGEIARTEVEAERAAEAARSARNQVASDVETSYAALKVSRERVELYESTYLAAAKESRDIAEFAYQKGGTSIVELLDAERTYRGILLAYAQARSSYLTAVFQLEAAVGGPSR